LANALTYKPDFDKLLKKIEGIISNEITRRRLLTRAILELKDLASAYPVAGAWNHAPGARGDNRWYQRNFGSRWKRKDGTIGGTNNSQQLQKNWRSEVMKRDEFSASAFTEVTYAPFLLDDEQRVSWAELHGWQSLNDIEEEYAGRFEELALDELDKGISNL
jgi:hypothetical protein